MVQNGRLTPKQVVAIDPPMYERSMEECDAVFALLADVWTVQDKFERLVAHPAYEHLQEKITAAGDDEGAALDASREYASVVVDWIIAAFSWLFIKALRTDGEGEEELLKPWTSSETSLLEEFALVTKEVFLEKFRDEKVEFCYLYFKLARK
ncbi:hypothetical protein EKO04_007696 [Ascochyta lentis]|uniref:Uncharacterized protein n=1 Tax=Ascochyta lentis TaxID=205686 RepID=A0A8H7J0X9_9PLEO|nr:hypothetical protein EKO04_007696 [Ascochyta lentis]